MRRQFDEQLEELAREMISMGAMIESAIDKACDALMRHDVAAGQKRDGGRSPSLTRRSVPSRACASGFC